MKLSNLTITHTYGSSQVGEVDVTTLCWPKFWKTKTVRREWGQYGMRWMLLDTAEELCQHKMYALEQQFRLKAIRDGKEPSWKTN